MGQLTYTNQFSKRHIGINKKELTLILQIIGVHSLDQLIDETVPKSIRLKRSLSIPKALSEFEYLR